MIYTVVFQHLQRNIVKSDTKSKEKLSSVLVVSIAVARVIMSFTNCKHGRRRLTCAPSQSDKVIPCLHQLSMDPDNAL